MSARSATSPSSRRIRGVALLALASSVLLAAGCTKSRREGGLSLREHVALHCRQTRDGLDGIRTGYAKGGSLASGGEVAPSYPLLLHQEAMFCGSLRGSAALPLLDRIHIGIQGFRESTRAADATPAGSPERLAVVSRVTELAAIYDELLAMPMVD